MTTRSEVLAAEEDILLKPRTGRLYLKRMGAQWRRTRACVRHKQDPALATAAVATLARLKKVPGRGAGPLLPRRNRLQPLPAPHLHLGPGRRAPSRPLREPRGPARERPDHPGRARHLTLGRGRRPSTACATPCPGAPASPASWSSTTPPATAPERSDKPVGNWQSRGSGSGTCRPTARS